jgi:hypothetical protein
MKFVWVNGRVPRKSSTCAHCGASLRTGYLRDISSQQPYCGYECCYYPASNDLVTQTALPEEPGVLVFPAFGLFG